MYQYRQQQSVFAEQNTRGEEVGFHIHAGEFESHYIISGTGHGIRNTGSKILEFIAPIVSDQWKKHN